MTKKKKDQNLNVFEYDINILQDGTYDLISHNNSSKSIFFGVDTTVNNFAISRLINNINNLISHDRNISLLTYSNNKLCINLLQYYNDSCIEERYIFNIKNKYKIKNKLEKEIPEILLRYSKSKKQIDRRIEVQQKNYEESLRIASIVSSLIKDFKNKTYTPIRIEKEDVSKVLEYIERHKLDLGKNNKLYNKSKIYMAKVYMPIALSAMSLGAIAVNKYISLNFTEELERILINTAAITGVYDAIILASPAFKEFLKDSPALNQMDKFIDQYKEIHRTTLHEHSKNKIEMNYEYSNKLVEIINRDIALIDKNKNAETLKLRKELQDLSIAYAINISETYFKNKGSLDINKYLNDLLDIEKRLQKIISLEEILTSTKEDILYTRLVLLGLNKEQIDNDYYIKYAFEDINYIRNRKYPNYEEDILEIVSVTLEYAKNKIDEYNKEIKSNTYIPKYAEDFFKELAVIENIVRFKETNRKKQEFVRSRGL